MSAPATSLLVIGSRRRAARGVEGVIPTPINRPLMRASDRSHPNGSFAT
jgi:hypothetical protein